MGTNNMSNASIAEVFREMIDAIENECVKKHIKFEVVAQERLYRDKDYLRCVFSEVAGMGVEKYIKRRQMTEIYLSLKDYQSLKLRATVKGIKRYKEKMKKEFGDSLENLQHPISVVGVEERIDRNMMKRIYTNYMRKIAQTRKKVNLSEKKVKVVDSSNNVLYDFDETYFVIGDNMILFKGQKELYSLSNDFLTQIMGCPVFSSVTEDASVNEILQKIHKFYLREKVDRKEVASLQMEEYKETGVRILNLISKVTSTEECIEEIEFLGQSIINENRELYFIYDIEL